MEDGDGKWQPPTKEEAMLGRRVEILKNITPDEYPTTYPKILATAIRLGQKLLSEKESETAA